MEPNLQCSLWQNVQQKTLAVLLKTELCSGISLQCCQER